MFQFLASGKTATNVASKEKVREWNRKLQHKVRELEKQISDIQRAEAKAKISCKQAVKDGQMAGANQIAKEIARSRKSIANLTLAKANISSIMSNLSSQVAMSRVVGGIQATSAIMEKMNELMKIDQLRDTVRELSREMEKADLISEAVDEGLDTAFSDEAADSDVQAVMTEILGASKIRSNDTSIQESTNPKSLMPTISDSVIEPESNGEVEDDVVIDRSQMQARFAALRASAS